MSPANSQADPVAYWRLVFEAAARLGEASTLGVLVEQRNDSFGGRYDLCTAAWLVTIDNGIIRASQVMAIATDPTMLEPYVALAVTHRRYSLARVFSGRPVLRNQGLSPRRITDFAIEWPSGVVERCAPFRTGFDDDG